ncbi:hypothetical protein H6768_03855 [Candidatus Peribacteria bacterium]|nr:hypothetical protein [Candidatus Peribacteria bacterium]
MNTTPETPFREITQEELIAFTPSGFQLMPLKGETSNVLHVNVDGDNDEEILMIFNSNE